METLPKLVKPMETSSSLAYVQRFADERDDHGEVDESADDPADDQHSVEPQPISAGSFACANRKTSLPNLIKNDYTERERERERETGDDVAEADGGQTDEGKVEAVGVRPVLDGAEGGGRRQHEQQQAGRQKNQRGHAHRPRLGHALALARPSAEAATTGQ